MQPPHPQKKIKIKNRLHVSIFVYFLWIFHLKMSNFVGLLNYSYWVTMQIEKQSLVAND